MVGDVVRLVASVLLQFPGQGEFALGELHSSSSRVALVF
jgi:hypothetical protein